MISKTYQANRTLITIHNLSIEVEEYLDKFFESISSKESNKNKWIISIQTAPLKNKNKHGVTFEKNMNFIKIQSDDIWNLCTTIRHFMREIYLHELQEESSLGIIHVSSVFKDKTLNIFVGESTAGKTSTLLEFIYNKKYHALTNDHLVLIKKNDVISITTIPTYIGVRPGTYLKWKHQLPQLNEHCPENWNSYLLRSGEELRLIDDPMYFTNGQILFNKIPFFNIDFFSKINFIKMNFNKLGQPLNLIPQDSSSFLMAIQKEIRSDWIYDGYHDFSLSLFPTKSITNFLDDTNNMLKDLLSKPITKTFTCYHGGDLKELENLLSSQT